MKWMVNWQPWLLQELHLFPIFGAQGTIQKLVSGPSGNYSVTVTDSDQCTGTQSLVLNDPDELSAVLNITGPKCFSSTDGSVAFGATGGTPGYLYYWNDVLVNGTLVEQLNAGNYTLRITDKRECVL